MRRAAPSRAGVSAWKIRPGWYDVVLELEEAAVGQDDGNGGAYIADQLARMRHFRRASFASALPGIVRFELEVLARSVAAAEGEAREALQDLLFGDASSARSPIATIRVVWLSEMSAEG